MNVWAVFLGVVLAILFLFFVFWLFKKPANGNRGGPMYKVGRTVTGGLGMNGGAAGKNSNVLDEISAEIDAHYEHVHGMNESAAADESAAAEVSAFYEGLGLNDDGLDYDIEQQVDDFHASR